MRRYARNDGALKTIKDLTWGNATKKLSHCEDDSWVGIDKDSDLCVNIDLWKELVMLLN